MPAAKSDWRSGKNIIVICFPMASWAVYPHSRSDARFQLRIVPSRSVPTMLSSEHCTIEARNAWVSWEIFCSIANLVSARRAVDCRLNSSAAKHKDTNAQLAAAETAGAVLSEGNPG